MLSKQQIQYIRRLKQKKYRRQEGLFVAEGAKIISELRASHLELHALYSTTPEPSCEATVFISEKDLRRISFLTTPNKALAIFKIPKDAPTASTDLSLALDTIGDPGNLGTIIRLCDWFGISQLICSHETVDCYNPKVIQATMGSIARVRVHYLDLKDFLEAQNAPVFGTFMAGKNIYETSLPKNAILVMGNEANGISKAIEKCISERISIPRFNDQKVPESLNVATATAVLLSEFKR